MSNQPPFTVSRYGSLGATVAAELEWTKARLAEVERLLPDVAVTLRNEGYQATAQEVEDWLKGAPDSAWPAPLMDEFGNPMSEGGRTKFQRYVDSLPDSAAACSECGHSGGTETDMGYSCPTCSKADSAGEASCPDCVDGAYAGTEADTDIGDSAHPLMLNGVIHNSSCWVWHTPTGRVTRSPCNCGATTTVSACNCVPPCFCRICHPTLPTTPDQQAETVSAADHDPTPWCTGCGARRQADCNCGPLADND